MSGLTGLSQKELLSLSANVITEELRANDELLVNAVARVALSNITEPGDRFAGWLLERFSAAEIVNCLIAGFDFDSLLSTNQRKELHQSFGDTAALYQDAKQRWKPRLSLASLRTSLESARRLAARVVVPGETHWPSQLADLRQSMPLLLWVRGDSRLLKATARSASIVGSRLATSYGENVTTDLVSVITAENAVVVSGGAYGIDAIAHRATLALNGFTVAVLAGGIDRLYPAGNHDLLVEIAETNLLVSEQPPSMSPTKWRFLQRNRIIAALGSATVVVEAGARSGALNTAHHAGLLNRPVGAIPGRIDSPQSAGTHALIRDGSAILLGNGTDVLELAGLGIGTPDVIQSQMVETTPNLTGVLGALEVRALDALGKRAKSAAEIAKAAGLTDLELQVALGKLELLGLVVRKTNGWLKRE